MFEHKSIFTSACICNQAQRTERVWFESYETSVHILNSATGASQIKGLSGSFMGLEMRRRRR